MSHEVLLQGKVAQVLNERELVVNIGQIDGVMAGALFEVLARNPIEIRDPDTNELLGTVDRAIARVVASQVFERFAICTTYVSKRGSLTSQAEQALRVADSALPPPLYLEDSYPDC